MAEINPEGTNKVGYDDLAVSRSRSNLRDSLLWLLLCPSNLLDTSNGSNGSWLGAWAASTNTAARVVLAALGEDLVKRLAKLVWHVDDVVICG